MHWSVSYQKLSKELKSINQGQGREWPKLKKEQGSEG